MRRHYEGLITENSDWDGKVFGKDYPSPFPKHVVHSCHPDFAVDMAKHLTEKTGKPHYIAIIDYMYGNISDDINEAKNPQLALALILEVLLNEHRYSQELTSDEIQAIKHRLRGIIATLKEQERGIGER